MRWFQISKVWTFAACASGAANRVGGDAAVDRPVHPRHQADHRIAAWNCLWASAALAATGPSGDSLVWLSGAEGCWRGPRERAWTRTRAGAGRSSAVMGAGRSRGSSSATSTGTAYRDGTASTPQDPGKRGHRNRHRTITSPGCPAQLHPLRPWKERRAGARLKGRTAAAASRADPSLPRPRAGRRGDGVFRSGKLCQIIPGARR
jgi:hypothetical protein